MIVSTRTNRMSTLREMFPMGSEYRSFLDRLCALLFALTPIVQHYYGLYENSGFTFYLLILPLMLWRLIQSGFKINKKLVSCVLPLVLFELYCLVARIDSLGRVLYGAFFALFLILLYNRCINISHVVNCAIWIGTIATVLVIIQYISYYLFHYVLNFEPHRWLLPENSRWDVQIVYNPKALYRPSGFFLEPSHIFLYCFPLITFCLLLPGMNRWRRNTALFLSMGVILSTSGMGIAIVIALWGMYFLFRKNIGLPVRQQIARVLTLRNIIIALVFVAALVAAYFTVPVFRRSIHRIFTDDVSSNAIAGRTRRAGAYLRNIRGLSVLFGTAGVRQTVDFSMAGFQGTYIKWGVIGLLLTYTYYIKGLFRLDSAYVWFSLLLIMLSFFTAHTHGTFYMMYFSAFLANDYYICSCRRLPQVSLTRQPLKARFLMESPGGDGCGKRSDHLEPAE